MFVYFVLFGSFWLCDHLCGFYAFYKDPTFCVLLSFVCIGFNFLFIFFIKLE
jgi:hypothetical protein